MLEIPMTNLKLYGITWHYNPWKRSKRKWGLEQLKKNNLPPTSLCHKVPGVYREPDISLLWSLTSQPIKAFWPWSNYLLSIAYVEKQPATPQALSLSLSPEITANAARLYVKQRGKRICFPQTELRSHYMPCQVQSLKLQGWIFTSHYFKAHILAITSIYFSVMCVG